MPRGREQPARVRPPLTRERVVHAAIAIADDVGVVGLTMRGLAAALHVQAMSLYHHVRSKDEVLGGMVDAIFEEIDLPAIGDDWRPAMRRRAISARQALRRHRWAIGLTDSRADPGPATLRHHEAVVGTLRHAGFSVAMAARAFALLDSYVYGFVVQEAQLPFETTEELAEVAGGIVNAMSAEAYPNLMELALEHVLQPGYDFADEFEYGLDLVLDALEQAFERDEGAS
ncbi:TetR/AcrR family transcriptional regulator C-terminal domain-containing protein [soil metagenome]